jgi:hypothetical protein
VPPKFVHDTHRMLGKRLDAAEQQPTVGQLLGLDSRDREARGHQNGTSNAFAAPASGGAPGELAEPTPRRRSVSISSAVK